MKHFLTTLLFCLLVVGGTSAFAQDAPSGAPPEQEPIYLFENTPHVRANVDSVGFGIVGMGAGLVSPQLKVVIWKSGDVEILHLGGNQGTEMESGVYVLDEGKTILFNTDKLVFSKKTYNSHSEAAANSQEGEEYYIRGDPSVYHKPKAAVTAP